MTRGVGGGIIRSRLERAATRSGATLRLEVGAAIADVNAKDSARLARR